MKPNTLGKIIFLFLILFLIFIFSYQFIERHRELANRPLPTELHPIVAEKKMKLIDLASKQGINIIITDGFRSFEEQDILYAQGRTNDGAIVTNAQGGQSYHNYGLAIDFALQLEDGQVLWDLTYDGNNSGQSDWMEVVEIAKELGFTWGGDWEHFPDYPHLQMDFGLTIRELQRGYRPGD
ncbi:peptidoglycan L-alanyl-D-glutamate endopeptidase CwlK [Natronobacillus azotifigens]|uniref:M15 family metallopeptidase n=1 Tax=Natronobacillus azotifigens TaxID=472978 RepID=A0A9J6R8P9_9BACI|nr:M15 family metallopeptidase [Natronobacillus azotifigens]MCZ0701657.1 M15 family metallopeptidase [Natronobacillus azotifigens]